MKPLIKCAGGKTWLVPRLQSMYRNSGAIKIVEPFAGGAALTLDVEPQMATLADTNWYMINFYKQIQAGKYNRIQELITRNAENVDWEIQFAGTKTLFNATRGRREFYEQEYALWFYLINRMAFNGLYRENKNGEFNVGFGKYKKPFPPVDWPAYTALFKRFEFKCQGYEETLQRELAVTSTALGAKHIFVYLDPPYYDTFSNYSKDGFTIHDHKRLAEMADMHDGPIVVSNSLNDEIIQLYEARGFQVEEISGRSRRINSNGEDRGSKPEMLAYRGL